MGDRLGTRGAVGIHFFVLFICIHFLHDVERLLLSLTSRDLVRGGAPGAWAPGVFENLLNKQLQFHKYGKSY